uniref:Uncharacterized protein n=1 Tax=Strigamia maritima TaxID=126957 RepID=T1IJQ2_STRMM
MKSEEYFSDSTQLRNNSYCTSCNNYNTQVKDVDEQLFKNCASCDFYLYLKGERGFLLLTKLNSQGQDESTSKKTKQQSNSTISSQRKHELREKLQYAAREFGRICTKSNHIIPKEHQVSIDLGNKLIFNYMSQQLLQIPLTCKSTTYIYEVGSKEKIFGVDTTLKYFTPQEQDEHTRTPKLDEFNELRLYNKDGSIYDTTDVLNAGGRIIYAVSLDCKLITVLEVFADYGIEFCYWHSTLLAGGPGLCFGSLIVKNGKIVYFSNHSGHYNPTAENLYNVIIKLNGLFSADAVLRVYFKSFDKNGVFRTDMKQTKVISEKYYCTVKEFVERVEKGLLLFPGENKVAMPGVYFEEIREWNECFKNMVSYKPVSVYNGNVVMAIEHSIRKLIGGNFGHKPSLGVDQRTFRVKLVFRDQSDALKFHSILEKIFNNRRKSEQSAIERNFYLDNFDHTVFVWRRYMYDFIVNVLKIKLGDIFV